MLLDLLSLQLPAAAIFSCMLIGPSKEGGLLMPLLQQPAISLPALFGVSGLRSRLDRATVSCDVGVTIVGDIGLFRFVKPKQELRRRSKSFGLLRPAYEPQDEFIDL